MMLIGFKVKNFLSFNQEIVFTMKASRGSRFEHHYETDDRILKASIFYGKNAAGKSNLIEAIKFAQEMILRDKDIDEGIYRNYFKLDKQNAEKPSEFMFEFKIDDRVFNYSFGVNKGIIVNEELKRIHPREKVLFSRDSKGFDDFNIVELDDSHRSTSEEKNQLRYNAIARSNQLLLRELIRRGINDFKDVYDWFTRLIIINPSSRRSRRDLMAKDDNYIGSFIDVLKQMDTGIQSIDTEVMDEKQFLREFPKEILSDVKQKVPDNGSMSVGISDSQQIAQLFTIEKTNGNYIVKKLVTQHLDADGDPVSFELWEESSGTRRLFDLIPQLIQMQKDEHVFIVDEIENSLHPHLIYKFFELFFEITKHSRSQIIATTHEDYLLDLNLFRKDEIWLVEKNEKGESSIYSLDEFKIRNDAKIEIGYHLGRYGGIPKLKNSMILSGEEQ